MTNETNTTAELPALVGTLATLPEHVQKVIEAYGKACAAVAVKSDRASRAQATQAEPDAMEIWAAAQLAPGEGIEDGVKRIEDLLSVALNTPVNLEDIEHYRLQMAGISTAAIGHWKEGDGIHPDYDTQALRDVAELYAKYAVLHEAQAAPAEPTGWQPIETAPAAEDVLLYSPRYLDLTIAKWCDYCRINQPGFTHWMRLPPAPKE